MQIRTYVYLCSSVPCFISVVLLAVLDETAGVNCSVVSSNNSAEFWLLVEISSSVTVDVSRVSCNDSLIASKRSMYNNRLKTRYNELASY